MMRMAAAVTVMLVVATPLLAAATEPATRPTTEQKLSDEQLIDMPAFGVMIPPTPQGWEQFSFLDPGVGWWYAAIAGWRPIKSNSDEQIYLTWVTMAWGGQEDATDYFRHPARKQLDQNAKEVEVPHIKEWPTARFEQPAPSEVRGYVRAEVISANNVAYVLHHYAPKGESPQGRAMFEWVSRHLKFHPPAKAGRALRPGGLRVGVLGKRPAAPSATIELPEPFRLMEECGYLANALDMTGFTHLQEEPTESEEFSASMRFTIGERDVPKSVFDILDNHKLPRQITEWHRDDADLRLATPLRVRGGPRDDPARFVAGRKLNEQWLWVVLAIPERMVQDAGGDLRVLDVLEESLSTARAGGEASTQPAP
jgi:hypothetical protein